MRISSVNVTKSAVPQWKTSFFVQCPVLHTDDEKVMFIVRQLTKHILDLKIDIVGNRNIDNRGTGSRGLHLNLSGRSRFARNFVKIIKKF